MEEKEIIARAETLLRAYMEMFDRAKHENRFYGKTLEQLSVVYDEAECDSQCLRDDMEILLDDIEDWKEKQ